ncbi:hypothetical protein [Streptomyces sp. NPDC005407]|uniref:hypothetical protein n=1 Tax=Streptomyces sp. NPDC005407 TaxID=3155340 RepID=UPI0033B92E92
MSPHPAGIQPGGVGPEVPDNEIGPGRSQRIGDRGQVPPSAMLAQQSDGFPLETGMDTRCAVGSTRSHADVGDLFRQLSVAERAGTRLAGAAGEKAVRETFSSITVPCIVNA